MSDHISPPTNIELMKGLEHNLFDQLNATFDRYKVLNPDMMYDPAGLRSYVVVGFNHPTDAALLPEDASPADLKAALSTVTLTAMPYIDSEPNQPLSQALVVNHGVHAVAGSMLASILTQQAIPHVMALAQQAVLEHREKCDD